MSDRPMNVPIAFRCSSHCRWLVDRLSLKHRVNEIGRELSESA